MKRWSLNVTNFHVEVDWLSSNNLKMVEQIWVFKWSYRFSFPPTSKWCFAVPLCDHSTSLLNKIVAINEQFSDA